MVAILVVEDEVIVGLAMRAEFEDLGFEVLYENDAEDAMRRLSAQPFDAAIIDIGLPGMAGDVLARECRRRFPEMPIVLATGMHERDVRPSFTGDRKVEILEKPHHFSALRACLEKLGVPFPASREVAV